MMQLQIGEYKRKAKHAVEELQDVKLHHQTQSIRSLDLEKKQRKFDADYR